MSLRGGTTGGSSTGPPPPSHLVDASGPRLTSISPFFDTGEDALSTFAMDVDTASFTYGRDWIEQGQLPPADTVRPEEFVNYFRYDYPQPADGQEWSVLVDGAPSPWNPRTHLVRVGLATGELDPQTRPDATLTFVVDISGSMEGQPITTVKQTLGLLVDRLRPTDRIGIVTYGSSGQLLLAPTPLSEPDTIRRAIAELETGGSTYAEAGLRIGYETARRHLTPNGVDLVVLASDGVANVGETGPEEILATIRDGVDAGITLLAVGVGGDTGYNDHLMETLTNTGNGSSYFVSRQQDAERLFVDRLESTLVTVAKDAKVQVSFDPQHVTRWRLIGYDNRDVADDDFRNDGVDAGEVGAGHQVTAMYEVELADGAAGELGTVSLRWAHPKSGEVSELTAPIEVAAVGQAGPGYATAMQAVGLAELLRGSPHLNGWTLAALAEQPDDGVDPDLRALIERAAEAWPSP